VSSSPAFKCFIALLLPLTLAWKVAVEHHDASELASDIIKFLHHQAFHAVLTGGNLGSMPIIRATSGSCRVLIARVDANGSNQELVRDLATPTDHVFIIFRGRVYTQQPVLLTAANELWMRSLRKLGLMLRITPVIAAVASPSCDIERLPWETFI
jgi:hypothetical protein